MSKLICHQERVNDSNRDQLIEVCPFRAIEEKNGIMEVSAGCKMCMLCIKKGPAGVMELTEGKRTAMDKSLWRGIGVYVDHTDGEIHPVTMDILHQDRQISRRNGNRDPAQYADPSNNTDR